MPADARARLAEAQRALVASLIAGEPDPADFDPAQLRRTAYSLRSKRIRSVARTWPALAAALGDEFPHLFEGYAAEQPIPADASSLTDGRLFGLWLERQRPYPDAALAERLAFDLHYAIRRGQSRRQHGLVVRIARISGRRWVLAFRWL